MKMIINPKDKIVKNLIKKYKAFYKSYMRNTKDLKLSRDQLNAVGETALDEIIETSFDNNEIPIEYRKEVKKQLKELLRKECPDITFDSSFKFDEFEGFSKKE